MQEYNNNPQGDGQDNYGGGGNNNNNGNNGNGNGGKGPNIMAFIIVTLVALLIISYIVGRGSATAEELTYNEFLSMVSANKVESVVIDGDHITIEMKGTQQGVPGRAYYTGLAEDITTVTNRMLAAGIEVKSSIEDGRSMILSFVLTYVVPIALLWLFMGFLFRRMDRSGGGIFGAGKSNAKMYGGKETGITFKDVAGEDEAKESLVEIVDFLHNPIKYSKIGAKIPKGALLVGPPGTGKTLLAKAVAGEAGVPFFSLAGSDFVEMYVGVGASRVRDLFKEAEKSAPCIIFIDEIDAIGRSRDSRYGGGNDEREQTLNQLLSEMDGFDAKKGIILLAATNRPEILDKALLRPGRFDRRVIVEEPDLKGRVEILKVHSKDVLMDQTVNLEEIGLATVGAVGADLANMINEAAILAVKRGREYVSQKDLLDAVELVSVGKEKKDRVLSKQERRIVSYHETGHALISALMKNAEPVQKITIIPRTMGTLGYVLSYPEEEKFMQTEKELRSELVSLLGGRAAEDIVFDTVTTGAANDIEKATRIARAMVTRFGMSSTFGMMGLETVQDEYLNRSTVQNCADETAAQIDEEVKILIRNSYEEAKRLLTENREVLNKIADYLFEKETISGHEFMEIYCREKGLPMPEKEEGSDRAGVILTNESEEPKFTPDGKEIISVTRGREKPEKKPSPEVSAAIGVTPGAAAPEAGAATDTADSGSAPTHLGPSGGTTEEYSPVKGEGAASQSISAGADGMTQSASSSNDQYQDRTSDQDAVSDGSKEEAGSSFADEFRKRAYKQPGDSDSDPV
ncbi:MAG: ATP-dependent zinc metalloprotease FtsH [Lachnospiraceae bacterium]|nr:ATP-dependent zinc metalloprotease FtsH [Lachnospiraceae bacterium]